MDLECRCQVSRTISRTKTWFVGGHGQGAVQTGLTGLLHSLALNLHVERREQAARLLQRYLAGGVEVCMYRIRITL